MLCSLGRPYDALDVISRRGFLKIGALGFGGLSLADVLARAGRIGQSRRTSR